MSEVKSDAIISVYIDGARQRVTVQHVQDWLVEVDRLNIPRTTELEDCVIGVSYRSEILDPIEGESDLGVYGTDVLVGMPRA